jgi:hypothetical protein
MYSQKMFCLVAIILCPTWTMDVKKNKLAKTRVNIVAGRGGGITRAEVRTGLKLNAETLTKRQATQHGCLTSLLGDGDEGIEMKFCTAL